MARDPYEVVLADLRAKRDDIDKLINSLEAFRPTSVASTATLPVQDRPAASGPFVGLSIVDAAKAVLRERNEPTAVADITQALRDGGLAMNSPDPNNTVSSVLNRAFQQGNGVVRVGRGLWALPEWVPNVTVMERELATPQAGTPPPPPQPQPQPPRPVTYPQTSPMPEAVAEDDDIPF